MGDFIEDRKWLQNSWDFSFNGEVYISLHIRIDVLQPDCMYAKGNHTIADLGYGEIDIIGPSTLIFAPIKG